MKRYTKKLTKLQRKHRSQRKTWTKKERQLMRRRNAARLRAVARELKAANLTQALINEAEHDHDAH